MQAIGPSKVLCTNVYAVRSYESYCGYLFLNADKRPLAWALGAFNIETSDIKAVSPTKMAALGRFTFWREQVQKGLTLKGNPIIALLNATLPNKERDIGTLLRIIDAKVQKDVYCGRRRMS